ncbi:MAG: D-glycero-beta-D-manno-heptose 1,7-bisphosphate 7-phosphatase [Methanoregula sp.]
MAVFLDRDGVITQDPPHYAHRIDQVQIIPGSGEAIRLLNEAGFLIIVVSNQSGVARGYYDEKDVTIFNEEMKRQLSRDNAYVDAIYYCPHHPEAVVAEYRQSCSCRKPNPGMLLKAAEQYNIDLSRSFLVGDKISDILAGTEVKCQSILVLTGHGMEESGHQKNITVCTANNLLDAVKRFII